MAKRESMRDLPSRIQEQSVRELADWQQNLLDLVESATYRPGTRLVRIDSNGSVRVYEGWRAVSIAETLDLCSKIDGDLWIGKAPRFNAKGALYLGHERKYGAHMLWRQNNPEAAKENSRLQAKKSRERARGHWHQYCAAYREKFPDSAPIGFDRWCRDGHRQVWLAKGPAGVVLNEIRGIRELLTEEAQIGLSKKQGGPQGRE